MLHARHLTATARPLRGVQASATAVIVVLALLVPAAAAERELDARAMIEALRRPAVADEARHRNLAVVARVANVNAGAPAAEAAPGEAPATGTSPASPMAAPSLSLALAFASNSAELRPENGRVLGQLVAAILSPELRGQRFAIEGHTDGRGQAAANQRLSLERAEEVRQYLVALGVPAGRLRAVGRGAQDLANPADPSAPENRRVRVVALP